jgi:hypothetical protein
MTRNLMLSLKVASRIIGAGIFEAPPRIIANVRDIVFSNFAQLFIQNLQSRIEALEESLRFLDRYHDGLRSEMEVFPTWAEEFFRGETDFDDYEMSTSVPRDGDSESLHFILRMVRNDDAVAAETLMDLGHREKTLASETITTLSDLMRFVEVEGGRLAFMADGFLPKRPVIEKEIARHQEAIREAEKNLIPGTSDLEDVEVDFRDWKYVGGLDLNSLQSLLKTKGLDTFELEVSQSRGPWGGSWDKSRKKMFIALPDEMFRVLDWYEKTKVKLVDVIEHEVMHLGQDYLPLLKGLESRAFGLPSSRQPQTQGTMDLSTDMYFTHPKEFYPWLKQEASAFSRNHRSRSRTDRETLAKEWVGASETHKTEGTSMYFWTLKQKDRNLWKKAVREFLREVLR